MSYTRFSVKRGWCLFWKDASLFLFYESHSLNLTVHTKKICFWNGCRRSDVGKRFCLFLVQTLRILLIPRWENWTRTIRSGSWKKELNEKNQDWENTKQFCWFYFDVCIFDFVKSFQRNPHGSFLDYHCHLSFGGIIFCHYCFMYLIFVRSCIQWKSLREGLHWFHYGYFWDSQIWLCFMVYLTIGWEIFAL